MFEGIFDLHHTINSPSRKHSCKYASKPRIGPGHQFRCSIPVEHLDQPSIEEAEHEDLMQMSEDPSWQDPIIDYLLNKNLPNKRSEVEKI